MSDDDPVRAWLEELGDSDDPADAMHLAMDHAPALLSTPGVASALISDREGDAPRRLLLFAALVEQARLNMEGRGRLREARRRELVGPLERLTLRPVRLVGHATGWLGRTEFRGGAGRR